MLLELKNSLQDTYNLIVFSKSARFDRLILDMVKSELEAKGDTLFIVTSPAEFKEAKGISMNLPFVGGRWVISYDVSKVKSNKELVEALKAISSSRCTIFFCRDYKVFRFLADSNEVKNQGKFTKIIYGTRLDSGDIPFLYETLVSEGNRSLQGPLFNKFVKEYRFNVDAVFELFELLEQGKTFAAMKDIVAAVGLGRNSVNALIITMLKSKASTEKGKKMAIKKFLFQFQDLSADIEPDTIINFMLVALRNMITLKELQIMGKYTTVRQVLDVSENFDLTGVTRLRGFETILLEDISLVQLLEFYELLSELKSKNMSLGGSNLFTLLVYKYGERLGKVV